MSIATPERQKQKLPKPGEPGWKHLTHLICTVCYPPKEAQGISICGTKCRRSSKPASEPSAPGDICVVCNDADACPKCGRKFKR